MVCSTDRSKAVVPVLVLLFVALWFILRGDLLYVFPCVILFLCFSVLLVLQLPRLGKRELILVLFVRLFGLLVWICRPPLPLGVWEGLRFVIVSLPGLFSYLFFNLLITNKSRRFKISFKRQFDWNMKPYFLWNTNTYAQARTHNIANFHPII